MRRRTGRFGLVVDGSYLGLRRLLEKMILLRMALLKMALLERVEAMMALSMKISEELVEGMLD